MPTAIVKCTCQHSFQDAKEGSGNRVANQMISKGSEARYRCSVCKKEHTLGTVVRVP